MLKHKKNNKYDPTLFITSQGPIIAMPERCHRENSKALHPLGNKGGIDNRAEFNQWKREFWYDQALKELSRRGIK